MHFAASTTIRAPVCAGAFPRWRNRPLTKVSRECRLWGIPRQSRIPFRRPASVYNSPNIEVEDDEFPESVSDNIKAETSENEIPADERPLSLWGRIRKWMRGDKSRLQNLGMGAFLAYGFISNVNYGVFFTIAWLSHVKRTGMIPFARGQWQAFLGLYAGIWAIQNVMRPLRLAAAVALTPLVDQMMLYLVDKLGIKRGQAFLLLLIGLAVFTTSSLITGIWILGGIPARPPKSI